MQPKGVSRQRQRLCALRGRVVDEGRLKERKKCKQERRWLGALQGHVVDEGRLKERKTCKWHAHGAAAEVVRSIGLGADGSADAASSDWHLHFMDIQNCIGQTDKRIPYTLSAAVAAADAGSR